MKNEIQMLAILFSGFLISNSCSATKIERVYESSKNKVVKLGMIFIQQDKQGNVHKFKGSCSGAFIDSNGTILTCAHCVSDKSMTKLFVKLENESVYTGIIKQIDLLHDLALVKINLPYYALHFNLGNPVERGQEVLALGCPLGLQHSVGVGWVENVVERGMWYIIHSATMAPGSSGGPLVDLHGRLVGVNEAILMMNFFIPASGYYVAIDVDTINDFLNTH